MKTTAEKVIDVLRAHSLKEEKGGKYRSNSPLRPGSNSHGFCLIVHPDGEHGAYHDKVSNDFGTLYTLAEKLNIDVPRLQATETKRTYTGLGDYALTHGVKPEVFDVAGWYFMMYDDPDFDQPRPSLGIPTKAGTRYRFLDGEKPVYRSPAGYKNCWYGLRRAIDIAKATGQPITLCNGAPSVVVAQHFGVAACALAGGGQKIPIELLEEFRLSWPGDVIIALDCDTEGQAATQNYHEQLPTAAIVDLMLTARGDLADFCTLYTDQTLSELQKRAVKFEDYQDTQDVKTLAKAIGDLTAIRKAESKKDDGKLPELLDRAQSEIDALRQKSQPAMLMSFSDLISYNHKQLDERRKNPDPVQGLRTHITKLDRAIGGWPGGRGYVIYGDTNMGKSTLAVSIIARWLSQGAGLIVPTESPPYAYVNKIAACLCNIPYDLIDEGRLTPEQYRCVMDCYAQLEAMNCHVLDTGSPTPSVIAAAVRRGMVEFGYKWVLIDSISKMKYPGMDDIYNTTRLVMDSLQDLWRETNLPFLMTCQVGRNLKERSNKTPLPNDALGAGTVEQNADVIMSLYNHNHYVKLGVADPDENFPVGTSLVRVIKHRWKDAIDLGVTLKFVGGSGFYELEEHQDERGF